MLTEMSDVAPAFSSLSSSVRLPSSFSSSFPSSSPLSNLPDRGRTPSSSRRNDVVALARSSCSQSESGSSRRCVSAAACSTADPGAAGSVAGSAAGSTAAGPAPGVVAAAGSAGDSAPLCARSVSVGSAGGSAATWLRKSSIAASARLNRMRVRVLGSVVWARLVLNASSRSTARRAPGRRTGRSGVRGDEG